jgi:hypothetical protein
MSIAAIMEGALLMARRMYAFCAYSTMQKVVIIAMAVIVGVILMFNVVIGFVRRMTGTKK